MNIIIKIDRSAFDTDNGITDAEYATFCDLVRERVERAYPEAVIEFEDALVSSVAAEGREGNVYEYAKSNVEFMVCAVAEAGEFWGASSEAE